MQREALAKPVRPLARPGPAILLAALLSSSATAHAQSDSAAVTSHRATLLGWEEAVRFAIFDRAGSGKGRTSERGILQRFDEAMDAEYELDLISSSFSLAESYRWHRSHSGARFWAGSIDHLRLVQQGDFKARVGLGSAWSLNARFVHDETLTARRNLVGLGFAKLFAEGRYSVFVHGTLRARKPESDIELGFAWSGPGARLTVAVAALDLFNDLIFQTLEVDPGVADTTLDYTAQPFTARFVAELQLGHDARVEVLGLAMSPTSLIASSGPGREPSFEQDERYAYGGGLFEWAPSQRGALGGFATWVRARIVRAPLAAGRPEDAFDLTETTARLGIYALRRLTRRLAFEGWLARIWRLEDRTRPAPAAAPQYDYEDRTWAGRASLTHGAGRGLELTLGLDLTSRRASGSPPVATLEALDRSDFRLRLDLGWRFGDAASLAAGAGLDLDSGRFDGAHGRFRVYW